jgi:hypothetical protein
MRKVLLQTFSIFRKNKRLLEKGIGNVTEVDSNTVKQAIMRIKTGKAAGPGDISIEMIKRGGQKLLEMITILLDKWTESSRSVCVCARARVCVCVCVGACVRASLSLSLLAPVLSSFTYYGTIINDFRITLFTSCKRL